jgi:hypothetical protein
MKVPSRHILISALSLLLVAAVASPLQAQQAVQGSLLYAVTFWEQKIITIDTNTGAGTLITNAGVGPRDLAALGGALYIYGPAGQSVKLTRIDPWTGGALQTVTFTNSVNGGEGALDFRSDGQAFATTSIGTTGTLFRLEASKTNVTFLTGEGGLNPSLDGLAFDPGGTLYGLSQNRGGAFSLYTLNQVSGEPALVGHLGVNFPFNGGAVAGLAFAPNGDLFAGLGSQTESRLYRVNKATGVATLVGPVGFAGVSGLRFFNPPPGPLTARNLDSDVRVAWPHLRGGVLETAAHATGPWTTVLSAINTNGAEASILWPHNGVRAFFQLRR